MYNHQKLEIFKMLLYREMDEKKKKSGSSIYSMKESNELSNCEKTWVNHKSTFLIG